MRWLTFAMVALSIAFYVSQSHVRDLATATCQRQAKFAPELAVAYARYHILSPAALEQYREGISKNC